MPEAPSNDEGRMTFTEHLSELRTRIIYSGATVAVLMVICLAFGDELVSAVIAPLRQSGFIAEVAEQPGSEDEAEGDAGAAAEPEYNISLVWIEPRLVFNGRMLGAVVEPIARAGAGEPAAPAAEDEGAAAESGTTPVERPGGAGPDFQFLALTPVEGFLTYLKVSAYAAVAFSLPVIMYQLCAFIFPGLLPRERKAVRFLLVGSSILALAGVGLAYFVVVPMVLPYLSMYLPEGVFQNFQLSVTVSMLIKGMLGFALAFQFPMVVIVMVYLDLLSPKTLREYRKMAVVIIAIGSAIFTPAEPISMMIMMVPLVILYELSIWASYFIIRNRPKPAGAP
jgi:sec-independent protein translocase protein TatC